MTLLWMEGFELAQNSTDLGRKYDTATGTIAVTGGRVLGKALEAPSDGSAVNLITPDLSPTGAVCVVGGSLEINDPDTFDLFDILDGGSHQLKLKVNRVDDTNFTLSVLRGATVLSTSSNVSTGWNTIEFKATINTSTGSYDVRVNGVSVTSGSSVNTANAATNSWDAVEFEIQTDGTGGDCNLDDVYILDGNGSIRNDFLGTVVIEGLFPDGDGTTNAWTPAGGGSNYSEVDEQTVDDDTTYVESAANSSKDLYNFGGLQFITGNILGVMANTVARLTISGSRTFEQVYRDATTATEDEGTVHTITSTTYDHFHNVWEQNPESGPADWTVSDINNGQFGVNGVA